MSADATRRALEAGIRKRWRRRGVEPLNSATADRMAQLAAAEVLDALQANPAWVRGLGITPDAGARTGAARGRP